MKKSSSASLVRLLKKCDLPLAYTPEQVAKILHLRQSRVDYLVTTFRIRSVFAKGRRMVTRAEVERHAANRGPALD